MFTVNRVEELVEIEFVWKNGRFFRRRKSITKGEWKKKGDVFCGSSKTPSFFNSKQARVVEENCKRFFHLSKCLNFKVVFSMSSKKINRDEYSIKSYYFEVGDFSEIKTLLLSAYLSVNELSSLLINWISGLLFHDQLPEKIGSYKIDLIVFSPESFGALLHESIGHALEDKNFQSKFKEIKTSFDVYDTPGEEMDWGYTPIDDLGSKGKNIRLLNGKTGKMTVLKKGNFRAVSWMWHPIVRQRVLKVRPRKKIKALNDVNTLIIEDVELGSWDEKLQEAELYVTQAKFLKNGSATHRIPSFSFVCSPKILSFISCMGSNRVFNPGGGCHKDLQRGLPVTFKAPFGILELSKKSKSHFKILSSN